MEDYRSDTVTYTPVVLLDRAVKRSRTPFLLVHSSFASHVAFTRSKLTPVVDMEPLASFFIRSHHRDPSSPCLLRAGLIHHTEPSSPYKHFVAPITWTSCSSSSSMFGRSSSLESTDSSSSTRTSADFHRPAVSLVLQVPLVAFIVPNASSYHRSCFFVLLLAIRCRSSIG